MDISLMEVQKGRDWQEPTVLQATTREAAWRRGLYAYMHRSFKKKQGNCVQERWVILVLIGNSET
jgi:hypothetical protein